MAPVDKLLSLDMGTDDCLYRLRRDLSSTGTVIYVHLRTLDILPADSLTYGPDLVKEFRLNVPNWNDESWTTLTVSREEGGEVKAVRDEWAPHFLTADAITRELPRINVLGVEVTARLKNRVSRARLPGQERRCILKTCPFAYQLRYFAQEVRAYEALCERQCDLVPRLEAYVFERSEEQVVGFVCEEVEGRFTGPEDYEECRRGVEKLHEFGVVHGDLNKYNIIMGTDGPRFIDLEKAVVDTQVSGDEFSRLRIEELGGLENTLNDEEGWGKPWKG
ncbi:hypothetical protein VE04_10165 [Pseudogymnoascus sp. 24MN13]|nr:hypothetical protein VE04_10165 [Pseudogymnoascus sp. 24MN13]